MVGAALSCPWNINTVAMVHICSVRSSSYFLRKEARNGIAGEAKIEESAEQEENGGTGNP